MTNVLECPDHDMNFSSTCCYGSQFNLSVCLNFQSPKRVNPCYLVCFPRLMPEIKSASTSSPGGIFRIREFRKSGNRMVHPHGVQAQEEDQSLPHNPGNSLIKE